jgi:peptide/nickel transport system substrate-binding protein
MLSRRRVLATGVGLGAGITGAALLGCGKTTTSNSSGQTPSASGSASTPQQGGTFTTSLAQSYPLDPQKVSATPQVVPGSAMSRVFQFKTSTDPATITDHVIMPDLGLSAESPDGITWTVKLRPDAKFQNIAPVNGHPVEAEDIKATFTRAVDPPTGSPNRGQLSMIDPTQIQTPDKQTVVFKLGYQYAPFRSLLASPAYSWILPREALAGSYDPAKTVIGSGPFIMTGNEPDVAFTYKRNPDWHLKPMPYIDTLKIAIIPDTNPQLAQFASGNLDEVAILDLPSVPTVKQQNPKATVYRVASGESDPVYFQLGDPASAFKDIRVRRAISMLINRDALAKAVYNGEGVEVVFVRAALGRWSLPVDKLDADTKQYYAYNPSEAKKLLDAAGQSNLRVRTANALATSNNPAFNKTAELLNSTFNSNGVASTAVNGDYNKDFVDAGKGWRQGYFPNDFVLYAGALATYTEADDWLFSYFYSKSTSNQEHLSDPTYDAMLDKERTLLNDDDRVKAVLDIQKYLAQQMYASCTAGSYAYWAVQPRVQNYSFSDSLAKATENYAKVWLRT